MSRRMAIVVALLFVTAAGVAVIVRSNSETPFVACLAPEAERIDPNSSQHVLPGATPPAYITDPPTSGAHRPGAPPNSVLTTELDKPAQVGILEAGRVLIQYRPGAPATKARLEELARAEPNRVVVAPNSTLYSKIVATAWLYKLECTDFREPVLRSFIDDHAQKAPAH